MTDTDSDLREAFEGTEFEVVETGNLELPTATPAVLGFDDDPGFDSADEAAEALEGGDYAFLDVYTKDGEDGAFHLSSKVYDGETNQFLKIKMWRTQLNIFPDDDALTFETFRRFVEYVEEQFDVSLSRKEGDKDE